MKLISYAAMVAALTAGSVHAAGLDRSGQDTSAIFAEAGTASLSFGYVMPSLTGTDSAGTKYDVGKNYSQIALSYTGAITDKLAYSVIFDQPYGADILYNGSPTAAALGGTRADLESEALTIMGKYQITPRVSVFGGVKLQSAKAEIDLNGTAYASAISVSAVARGAGVDSKTLGAALQGDPGAVAAIGPALGPLATAVGAQVTNFGLTDGYKFKMDRQTEPGYLIGAAYEIPDIAFRLAFTYHFEIEKTANTTENLLGTTLNSTVDYVTPQALNINFQTGIAADTLLTASYRWTDNSAVDVVPTLLGSDLVNLDDGHRYTLGVARRFNDEWSGSATLSYEPKGDDLVSPLGPSNGLFGLSIGARYVKDNVKFSGGINYTKLGDARAEVSNQPAATFKNNSVVGIGFKFEMTF